jgi:hypothetical protein
MSGLCPGPAVWNLRTGTLNILLSGWECPSEAARDRYLLSPDFSPSGFFLIHCKMDLKKKKKTGTDKRIKARVRKLPIKHEPQREGAKPI